MHDAVCSHGLRICWQVLRIAVASSLDEVQLACCTIKKASARLAKTGAFRGHYCRLTPSEVIPDIGIQLIFPAVAAAFAQALGITATADVGVVLAMQPFDCDPQIFHGEGRA